MKFLYKYPQAEFPYADLCRQGARRGADEPEYEILDTGVFDGGRYFDVFVEYAKAGPEDVMIRITAHNRGPEAATLHVLPHLWFRNTWGWTNPRGEEPAIALATSPAEGNGGGTADVCLRATHETLGTRYFYAADQPEPLFTDNE